MNNKQIRCCPDHCNDEIAENLKKIAVLQKAAVREELAEQMCDADELGFNIGRPVKFNTRPIQLFTDDDKAYSCPIERNEDGCGDRDHEKSCVFRVEKIEEGTVTVRALVECGHQEKCEESEIFEVRGCEENREETKKFRSTNSFKTIKLENIAAFRCLKDTFVDICIR